MDIKERILRTEIEYPKAFSSFVERDYGILFYDENNINSHDSNHAILYMDKVSNIENVLMDIKDFYLNKGITPRIYQPFSAGYFKKHRKALERSGYEIQIYGNNRFMLLTQENNINIKKSLEVKRILKWDSRVANDIFIPNGEEYEIDVARNIIKQENCCFFVGYLNDIAVATTYFHISEYGCTRFDYIVTAYNHRNKGYAREVLSYAVDYCKQNGVANCFQWPAHKTSEKICYEAGFRVLFEVEAGSAVWSPHIDA